MLTTTYLRPSRQFPLTQVAGAATRKVQQDKDAQVEAGKRRAVSQADLDYRREPLETIGVSVIDAQAESTHSAAGRPATLSLAGGFPRASTCSCIGITPKYLF